MRCISPLFYSPAHRIMVQLRRALMLEVPMGSYGHIDLDQITYSELDRILQEMDTLDRKMSHEKAEEEEKEEDKEEKRKKKRETRKKKRTSKTHNNNYSNTCILVKQTTTGTRHIARCSWKTRSWW